MVKGSIVLLSLAVLAGCGKAPSGFERTMENGVEVVSNPLRPAGSASPALTRIFSLDPSRPDLAAAGLGDIGTSFDVDAEGCLYFCRPENKEGVLLKFDRTGAFVKAFSRFGQGPGEIQTKASLALSEAGEIAVTDPAGRKIAFFSKDGDLIRELKAAFDIVAAVPLADGRFVVWRRVPDHAPEHMAEYALEVRGAGLEPGPELDRQTIPAPVPGGVFLGSYHVFSWGVSGDRIFTCFQDRGYEIRVFDFAGKLVRKIRKAHSPMPPSESYKTAYAAAAPPFLRPQIEFPEFMPPVDSIFTDRSGRLFVLTYEVDQASGGSVFDVFDADGRLTGRISLAVFRDGFGGHLKARGGKLYVLSENAEGFNILTVYGFE